jgi:hypothetical protein
VACAGLLHRNGLVGVAVRPCPRPTEQVLLGAAQQRETGTQVFERDHVVVLAQCVAGKDIGPVARAQPGARNPKSHPDLFQGNQVLSPHGTARICLETLPARRPWQVELFRGEHQSQ